MMCTGFSHFFMYLVLVSEFPHAIYRGDESSEKDSSDNSIDTFDTFFGNTFMCFLGIASEHS